MNIISGCPEVNNTEDFYRKADEYWREIPSTVDGMLGGFPHVSNIDANGSRKFLKSFIQVWDQYVLWSNNVLLVIGNTSFYKKLFNFSFRSKTLVKFETVVSIKKKNYLVPIWNIFCYERWNIFWAGVLSLTI